MRYTAKMPQYQIAQAQSRCRDKYPQYKSFCIYFIHLNFPKYCRLFGIWRVCRWGTIA